MFSFNKDSGCVMIWVTMILNGTYTFEQCPALFNMKDCVEEALIEMGAIKTEKEVK